MSNPLRLTRGTPMPFVDTLANVLAVPNKILFLNADFESHQIDDAVEDSMRGFVAFHDIQGVRIRLNEYTPLGELWALLANGRVFIGLRLTIGLLSWLAYCLNIGRLFGGDHYNPFSDSVNMYSNSKSIALHELGHVLDFRRRTFPGLYALVRMLPIVSLYQEYLASLYAVLYLREVGDVDEEMRAYRLLAPAYSTYVFGALVEWFPSTVIRSLMLPVILAGHVLGEGVAQHRAATIDAEDLVRQGDIRRARQMFSVATKQGLENWGTGVGFAIGSSMCGVMAPFGAWIGFRLSQPKQ